jgi:membrane protein DedA with SNARE-associated domain
MDKVAEISHYIAQYGYLAVFVLVFLQELGVPNPVSNELVLLYAGYSASTGVLSLPKIIITSVSADFIGTSILFFVFYAFGNYLEKNRPRWFPISVERMEKLKQRAIKGGWKAIYIGRLIPFVRGYISVGAGLVKIKPERFLITVIVSAITWSGGLVLAGWLIAPYWTDAMQKAGLAVNIVLILLMIVGLFFAGRFVIKRFFAKEKA